MKSSKVSREGKRFFLVALLIAGAALNTGNNLIYLILSMMLSIFLLSILILRVNMNRLVLKLSMSQYIFAKSPVSIDITISNNKRIIPSYSLRVLMPLEINGQAYFMRIPASSEVLKSISVVFKRRGLYKYGNFFIESSFPFIFFSRKFLCNVSGVVLVYPEIKDIDWIISEFTAADYKPYPLRKKGGEELSTIREFQYGDDWRRIHWKASAKTTKFMVKEYATDEPRKLTVILDNLMPQDSESFEKAVSLAASIVHRFLNDGFFVRLLTCKKVIPFGRGREHFFKILYVLAVIKGQDRWKSPMHGETEGNTILILNSEGSPLNRFISLSDIVIYATSL